MHASGLDFYALQLLAACGDDERFTILATPFAELGGWWGTAYIGAEMGGMFKPIVIFEELAVQALELSKHIMRWTVFLEPGAIVQDPAETGRYR